MIDLFRPFMSPDVPAMVAKTLTPDSNGRVYCGQGPRVEEFERGLQELLGLPEPPLSVNSCTSAIELALRLIGVGPGDVVISTPMTCTATNSAAVLLGAKIVWADVDPITGLIDPENVEPLRHQTRSARAILAVDWGGRACDYSRLKGAPVIQDAAHSLLGRQALGEDVDVTGDYICWSFQAIKHLTTGDGGALVAPFDQMERARLLRWYGLDRRSKQSFRCEQDITEVGGKWHMNDITASIGLANLPHAKWVVEQHRRNAAWYHAALSDLDGITLPPPDPGSSWWLYTILTDDRDEFIRFMGERGVECSQVHARNDRHTAFRAACINPDDKLPGLEYFSSHQVAIPVGWWLTYSERDQVASAVRAWAKRSNRVPT